MTALQISSLLIVLAALFGTLNYFLFRLPQAIGILVGALLASLAILGADLALPDLGLVEDMRGMVTGMHFSDALLEGMLGLLLFAGALHVDLESLKRQALPIALMATLGVAISTLIVGVGFSWLTGMPLLIALVFGVLISPTDPVAVMGILKAANLKESLQTKVAGESLFNDGVAYVVYLVLVGLAFTVTGDHGHGAHGSEEDMLNAAGMLFVQEALGGAALGAVLGWSAFQLMKRIDDYPLEVLITLALAFGGYELAVVLHVSAPIMAVVAGLLIGHVGTRYGMSDITRTHVDSFWKLIDEILNAVLFLMIGLEVFALSGEVLDELVILGPAAIALALVARFAAVLVPILALKPFHSFSKGVIPVMTWGGLKGGISIALALSLPESEWKPLILGVTYVVVIFSILVQGLTVGAVAQKATAQPKLPGLES